MQRQLLAVAAFALLWALFWLHSQRMYDDDYGRWLNPAQDLRWGQVIGSLLRPFPPDWGFLDRPAVMLGFKLGQGLVDATSGLWFVGKAAIFSGLVVLLAMLARRLLGSVGVRGRAATIGTSVCVALFVTAEPVFASLLWLSDMEVGAQLAVVAALLLYLRALGTEPRRMELVLLVLVAFVGFKFKATAKLIPLLLIAHLLLFERGRWRAFLPAIGLLVAACVPWGALAETPLPPMVDYGGEREWFYWRPANMQAVGGLLWGGGLHLNPFGEPTALPTGLAETWAPVGLVLSLWGAWIAGKHALAGDRPSRLILVWLALLLVTLSIAPDIPGHLLGRYLFAVHLPLALLAGLAVGRAWGELPRWLVGLALAAVLFQVVANTRHTQNRKRSQGCQMMIADRTAERIHAEFSGRTAFFVGLPEPEFDRSRKRNTFVALDPRDNAGLARAHSMRGQALLVTDRPLTPTAPWTERHRLSADDWPHWRFVGPPLGSCARWIYEPR